MITVFCRTIFSSINMSSPNFDGSPCLPFSPMSSPHPTQLAPQLEDSNTIFMNGTLDNLFQNHSLFPMAQPNYSPDAHQSFGFLSNFLQVNQTAASLPEYPLQNETSLLLQNSPEFPYNMSQGITNSFMEQNAEEMICGSDEASNKSSTVKRKQRNTSKNKKQTVETRLLSITYALLLMIYLNLCIWSSTEQIPVAVLRITVVRALVEVTKPQVTNVGKDAKEGRSGFLVWEAQLTGE